LNGTNPLNVECHTAFVDPGATASDTCDGVVSVITSGTVDPNTPGTYTLTYSATDAAGNTGSATRSVMVADTLAPVITLNGANPLNIPCHEPFSDPGATADDTCAGAISVSASGAVDVDTSGDYVLTYTATDPSGNSAMATRTVHVNACVGLALLCPLDVIVPADPGVCSAVVTFPDPVASGAVGAVTIVCNPPSGSIFPVGSTTVNCSATDSIGQTASCSFTVKVEDNENPTLICPPDLIVTCASEVPPADFAGGTVTDACDPTPVVNHVGDVPSGSSPTVITRTYQASDASGNTSTCVQLITVTGLLGDLNGDCCVDQADLAIIMVQIRARTGDLRYDINGDGRLDIADARRLVLLFTNPGGAPCAPR
jgi:hypothetical protein